jgi:hypothetical protein
MKTIRRILGFLIIIAGILLAIYVAGYVFAITSVMKIIELIIIGDLNAKLITWYIVKALFIAPIIANIIFFPTFILGQFVKGDW